MLFRSFSDARKYQYFRSHPLSADRIEALRRRVEGAPHYGVTDSPEALAEHQIIKAKLDAFMNTPQQTYIKYSEKDTSFVARYARAIAYYQDKNPDKALAAIDSLLKDQPNNPYLWELKGQVLFEFGRAPEAEAAHRRSVELKPDAPLFHINLAQTLIALEKKDRLDEAIVELKKALAVENDNAFARSEEHTSELQSH